MAKRRRRKKKKEEKEGRKETGETHLIHPKIASRGYPASHPPPPPSWDIEFPIGFSFKRISNILRNFKYFENRHFRILLKKCSRKN